MYKNLSTHYVLLKGIYLKKYYVKNDFNTSLIK